MFKDYQWYPVDQYMSYYNYKSGWPYVLIKGESGIPAIARWQPAKPDGRDPWLGTIETGEPAGWYDCMARRAYVLSPTRFMTITKFL